MSYAWGLEKIGTPQPPAYVLEFEEVCFEAGRRWGATHKKLPVHVQIGDRDVQIARSTGDWARAFVRGFRSSR